MNRIPDTRIHHGFNLPLLAAAALAVFGVASSHGAVLGVPGATQVEYTFGENGADWAVNFQTDASGNWRTMTGGGGSGLWTGGLLCIGSAKSLMIQGFCDAYGMNNTAGMATDFQVSIFLYASGRWPAVGDNGTGTAIFHIDDLSLQADGHPDGSMTYYASVAGTRLGSFTASENQSTGLMVQKLNNVFSYWVSTDYGTTWSQYGPDFSAPSAKNDFRNTHLFVRPGGGSNYWGNADEFKVVAVTAPGYATWAHNHAGDGAPSDDSNNDGVANGVAYFMDATGVATNPGIVDNTVTWPYLNAVTSFEVQVSDDLVIWENATTGVDTALPPGGHVTYTLPTGPGITKKFCRLMVVP